MALGPTSRFTIDEGFASSFGPVPALGCEGIPLAQIVATVHPDDRTGLATAIDEVIAWGGSYAHQYRVRRADERYYWIEANGRVDHGPDGTPLHFPGVLLDLDERRTVEQERDGAIVQLPRRGSRGIRTRSNKAYLERVAPGWDRTQLRTASGLAELLWFATPSRFSGQPNASLRRTTPRRRQASEPATMARVDGLR